MFPSQDRPDTGATTVPMTIRIAKGRDGVQRGDVPLWFDFAHYRFLDEPPGASSVAGNRSGAQPRGTSPAPRALTHWAGEAPMIPTTTRSFVLADSARVEQLLQLATCRRLFRPWTAWRDASRLCWYGCRVGLHWFGICSLGPGWVFDPHAQTQRAGELTRRRRKLFRLRKSCPEAIWDDTIPNLQFGRVAERVYWAIHERVLQAKRSVVCIPDLHLANRVWGAQAAAATLANDVGRSR